MSCSHTWLFEDEEWTHILWMKVKGTTTFLASSSSRITLSKAQSGNITQGPVLCSLTWLLEEKERTHLLWMRVKGATSLLASSLSGKTLSKAQSGIMTQWPVLCSFTWLYEKKGVKVVPALRRTVPLKPKRATKKPRMGDYVQKKGLDEGFNLLLVAAIFL